MSIRFKIYGFLILLGLLATGGYFGYQHFWKAGSAEANTGAEAKAADEEEAVPVELATVSRGEISSHLVSTANVRALREVDLASQSDGVVSQVLVEEGALVRKDQVLCVLDDTPLQIRLQTARQRLAQARLQLEKARFRQEKAAGQIVNGREDLERYERMFSEGLVSERDVALLRYKVEELEHDERVSSSEIRELTHRVEELEAEIGQVELELSRTRIRAPFGGYIVQRQVELGHTVRNLEPLFKLSDFSPLYVDVHVSELEALRVRPGHPVMLSFASPEGTAVATGNVVRISPVVDQATGTVKITAELGPNSDRRLRPGAFVRVEIRTDTREDSILIPKRALLEEDGEQYVFVVEEDAARRLKVELGYQSGDQVEVVQGLSEGDRVVVAGQGTLRQGSKVRVIRG